MSWPIKKTTSSEKREEILELRKNVYFNEDPEKDEVRYWDWEYMHNYYGEAEKFIVLNDQNHVIGYYAFIPQEYTINGKTYKAGLPVDAMIDPNYRRMGIFSQLQGYAIQNTALDFLIGYTIRKEVLPAELKGGYVIAKKIPVYIFPLKFSVLIGDFISSKTIAKVLGAFPELFYKVFLRTSLSNNQFTTQKVENLSNTLDDYFDRKENSHNIYLNKSNAYLKWRYDEIPFVKYQKYIVLDTNEKVIAYYVLREKEVLGINFTNIVDIELINEDKSLLDYILNSIKDIANKSGTAGIAYQKLDNKFITKRLTQKGFLRAPKKINLIMQDTIEKGITEQFLKSDKVLLNWSDTDLM